MLRGVVKVWRVVRVGRVLWSALTAPVFSASALASGLWWALAPSLATRLLWRWASAPETQVRMARQLRRLAG